MLLDFFIRLAINAVKSILNVQISENIVKLPLHYHGEATTTVKHSEATTKVKHGEATTKVEHGYH